MNDQNERVTNSSMLHIASLSLSISALIISAMTFNSIDRRVEFASPEVGKVSYVKGYGADSRALDMAIKSNSVSDNEGEAKRAREEMVSDAKKRAIERLNAMRETVKSNPSLVGGEATPDPKSASEAQPPEQGKNQADSNLSPEIDLSQLRDRGSYLDYKGTQVMKLGYNEQGGRKSLSESREDRASFAKRIIEQGDRFSFVYPAKGDEKARVVVFTDPTCPYCQRLHKDVEKIQEQGVTVHYIMFPRALARGYNDLGAQQVLAAFEYAWCSKTPAKALDEVYNNGVSGYVATSCSSQDQERIDFPYSAHYFMVQLAGISATPVTITEDGREIKGYRDIGNYLSQIGI